MRNFALVAILVCLLLPVGVQAAVVNINTATAIQLDTLPGIGPTKAAAIIDYRTTHGPFAKIEDIINVKGIGPSTYEGLRDLISVSGETTQPSPPPARSTTKQTTPTQPVGTANTTSVTDPAHAEEEVSAPRATAETVALGAASPSRGILHSVWTLVFLGIVLCAGATLMIL